MIERKPIRELPRQTSDKIAAGEVVDRPLSIVKELVENSIDADAKRIVVEIRKGGKSYIRVTDDGIGIRSDETVLAFRRHATSKLQNARDLNAIETLGFRGEALASIAAVSRTELITKTEDEETGTSVRIEGGAASERNQTGCPVGTTIIVRDLFYNTPARMKFLKQDHTESSLIIDFVSKVALAYPGIRIRMINNGNTLFATPGKGDRFQTITTIYDPNIAKKLIAVKAEHDRGLVLEGYISPPSETRATRKSQIFFVNGRYIQSRILQQAVTDAYREKMFEGRYPVVFLFLKTDPSFLDVNIHPNKREIRFDDDRLIHDFVTETLRRSLAVPEAVPEITFRKDRNVPGKPQNEGDSFTRHEKQEQIDFRQILKEKRKAEVETRLSDSEESEYAAAASAASGNISAGEVRLNSHTGSYLQEDPAFFTFYPKTQPSNEKSGSRQEENLSTYAKNTEKTLFYPIVQRAENHPFDVRALRPIGSVFATYILACDQDAFYMIDQHAAHERILYEKLAAEFIRQEPAGQQIALPIHVNVTHAVKSEEEKWKPFLFHIGFETGEFGPQTYIFKSIPQYMDLSEAERFLHDFFDSLEEPGAFRDRHRADQIITKACKSAVKANDALSMREIQHLIDELSNTVNPFTCPHGRPTMIRMTKNEIAHRFQR